MVISAFDKPGCMLCTSQGKPPSLYVRERIQIESSRMEQDGADIDLTLAPDPADPHSYFVTSVEGVYLVRLPWVELLEQYAASTFNCK